MSVQINRNNRLDNKQLAVDESIFATQNRYLGIRGNFEEGTPFLDSVRGTYINGVYDRSPLEYGEKAYGFPEETETIVNLPDAQTIEFYVNDKPLNLNHATIIDLKRSYHLRNGYTKRIVVYETKDKQQFELTFKRMSHLKHHELAIFDVTVKALTNDTTIKIVSTLNGDVSNYVSKNDPRAAQHGGKRLKNLLLKAEKDYGLAAVTTHQTNIDVLVGFTHNDAFDYKQNEKAITATKNVHIKKGESYHFVKYALYQHRLIDKIDKAAFVTLIEAVKKDPVNKYYESQKDALKPLLEYGDIKLVDENREDAESVIHYNLYQLYTAGGHNEYTNIAAKGLTGEGYEGHTFWDTEIYLIPFFTQIEPTIAKNLLLYRYHQLPHAKHEAKLLGVNEGVKFAWRTISGKETSGYYPAGTAQYHINSDIAYALIKYYQQTNDEQFMKDYGIELLLETARFFKNVVHKHKNTYHLHHVTGPDEYTAVIDDNYYTNAMLKYHLKSLLEYYQTPIYKDSFKTLNFTEKEKNIFEDIAKHLILHHDNDLNIDAMDASFLSKPEWPSTYAKRPLLLHYHPLTIYRHQILKQADTVLAHVLLHDRDKKIMKNSFDYYETRTTHDSSLSACIHSIQAARLGDLELSYDYYIQTLATDLDNVHGNTHMGLHFANIGGVYLSLLYGFLGFKTDPMISLSPRLPKDIKHLKMPLRFHGQRLDVSIRHHLLTITVEEPITLKLYDKEITIASIYEKNLKHG